MNLTIAILDLEFACTVALNCQNIIATFEKRKNIEPDPIFFYDGRKLQVFIR